MTTPVSPDVPLRDEDALKRFFFAQHASLGEKARAQLGADAFALAPKVVEGAFVRAWDARSQFKSAEELSAFLTQDVHHAAARALSRRVAAHRFAGHAETHHASSGEINPEESWLHIQHALHGEAHAPGALAAVAAASRHEAAGHIKTVGSNRGLAIAVGLAVAAAVVVLGGMKVMDIVAAKGKVAKAVNSTDVKVVQTPPGRAGEIGLRDGSTVHVAPDSKLSIAKDFGPELRGVKIEGVATFDVAPGLKAPFQAFVRNAVVVAKGTSFTVRAYPEDTTSTVVVGEGSVELRVGEKPQDVSAGSGVVVSATGARAATPDEIEEVTAWRKGSLSLSNRTLKDGVSALKRWYGYDVRVADVALLKRPITVKASLDSAMQAVQQVAKSAGVRFGYVGENMAFVDSADRKTRLR